jgi:hypothetical protein
MGKEKQQSSGHNEIDSKPSESLENYFADYLRNRHPDWSDDVISKRVTQELQKDRVREFIAGLQQMDQRLKEQYPEISWTTWFDTLQPPQ